MIGTGHGPEQSEPLRQPPEREVGPTLVPGGGEESPVRKLLLVSAVLGLACAATSLAGERRQRPKRATGTFVSAKLEGDVIKWQLDLGQDAGKKTFEMTADVRVRYAEKEGVKQAQSIRRAGGREFRAREGTVTVKGKFVAAKLQGEKVLVTVTPAEGEKAAPLEVTLPKQLSVWYREGKEGKLTAYGIGVPRQRGRPKEK